MVELVHSKDMCIIVFVPLSIYLSTMNMACLVSVQVFKDMIIKKHKNWFIILSQSHVPDSNSHDNLI